VAADLINDHGLKLADLTEKTIHGSRRSSRHGCRRKTRLISGRQWSLGNKRGAPADHPIVLEDENVDAAVILPFASPISERMDIEPIQARRPGNEKTGRVVLFGFIRVLNRSRA